MSIPARRDLKRQFWLLVRAGALRDQAAVALGLNHATGERWFSQAGGVIPCLRPSAFQWSIPVDGGA